MISKKVSTNSKSVLSNQVVVITGASSGIGKAITLGLADNGSKLCIVGRNMKNLEAISNSPELTATHIKNYKADLTLHTDIQKLKTDLQQDFGYVDILIHSAGIFSMGMLEDTAVEDFDRQYRINVQAPYLLTQTLLPMLKSRRGQIVFINSSVGLKARANLGQYAATKHALRAIADSLREEINKDGVRVLNVFMGRTATPMQAKVNEMEGRTYMPERLMQPEDVATAVINALSMPRTAEITDISIRPMMKFD